MASLGERIKELRLEHKLKQEELGKMLGVSKSTICSYENNQSAPNDNTKKKITEIFNVSLDYLLGTTDIRRRVSTQEDKIETKACSLIDTTGLTDEDIKKVEEYVQLMKLKNVLNINMKNFVK